MDERKKESGGKESLMENVNSDTTPVLLNKVIIVGFDGTLCKHTFPDVGEIEPNVKSALERLKDLGYTIRIHSCRTATYWNKEEYRSISLSDNQEPREKHIKCIQNFMEENDLPYDAIIVETNMDKPIAEYYIDDRAIRYEGNWLDVVKQIEDEQ